MEKRDIASSSYMQNSGMTALCLGCSTGILSLLSMNAMLSILSLNSAFSLASINSFFSACSFNSAFSIGCANSAFQVCSLTCNGGYF